MIVTDTSLKSPLVTSTGGFLQKVSDTSWVWWYLYLEDGEVGLCELDTILFHTVSFNPDRDK